MGKEDEGAEEFMSMVVHEACPRVMLTEEVLTATEADGNMVPNKEVVHGKQWKIFLDGAKALTPEDRMAMTHIWGGQR